ncbi:MAG: hypothetical protein A2V65_08080 [Deltaproteobacteria bacterium RBG_13_49_15]|nr:MAG: hypothetical protein A2V65_08080 [Deltaproteobacteria bacterium RBG_13_49_15]
MLDVVLVFSENAVPFMETCRCRGLWIFNYRKRMSCQSELNQEMGVKLADLSIGCHFFRKALSVISGSSRKGMTSSMPAFLLVFIFFLTCIIPYIILYS